MKILSLALLLITLNLTACLPPTASTVVIVGEAAPEFTAIDTNGIEHSLSNYRGKNIVLEWSNHLCPFVKKHYNSGNMQELQKAATKDGTIWLTIISSAEGKQGNVTADKANQIITDTGAKATARILDPTGKIGKLYDAKTTPHIFIINKGGILAYAGAIDSDSSFRSSSITNAINYITEALNSINAGKPVKIASTKPYGCSVKY